MTSERRTLVLEAPLARALWSLSWPMAIANQLVILNIGVAMFWLGRLIGEPGLVVESLFRPFGLLVSWVLASTSVGASVLVSRSVGAADGRGLSIAAGTVTLTLAMWAAFAVLVLPFSPWLADLLAGDAPVDRPMLHFLLGWLLFALPAIAVAEALVDIASSTGDTKMSLVRVLVSLAFLAAAAPVLMNVAGFGIAGAPIAEGIGALLLCPALWLALVRRRSKLALGEMTRGAWRIRWPLWKELLVIGMPVQLSRIAAWCVQLILLHRITFDGPGAVAGYGIAGALLLFGTMTTMAVAQGGGILVGQSLGAGLRDRAHRGARATLLGAWLTMVVFVVVTLLFDRSIIGVFTSDPEITDRAAHALSIVRWAGFGMATFQTLMHVAAAHKATVKASVLNLGSEVFGLVVAFAWPGSYLDAACVNMIASSGLKAGFLLWLLVTGAMEPRPSTDDGQP